MAQRRCMNPFAVLAEGNTTPTAPAVVLTKHTTGVDEWAAPVGPAAKPACQGKSRRARQRRKRRQQQGATNGAVPSTASVVDVAKALDRVTDAMFFPKRGVLHVFLAHLVGKWGNVRVMNAPAGVDSASYTEVMRTARATLVTLLLRVAAAVELSTVSHIMNAKALTMPMARGFHGHAREYRFRASDLVCVVSTVRARVAVYADTTDNQVLREAAAAAHRSVLAMRTRVNVLDTLASRRRRAVRVRAARLAREQRRSGAHVPATQANGGKTKATGSQQPQGGKVEEADLDAASVCSSATTAAAGSVAAAPVGGVGAGSCGLEPAAAVPMTKATLVQVQGVKSYEQEWPSLSDTHTTCAAARQLGAVPGTMAA